MDVEYKIISEGEGFFWIWDRYGEDGQHIHKIEQAVNFLLKQGWELLGGASSIGTAHRAYYIQSMILKTEDTGRE